ncbi:site-specific DNA-methyltransferase (adenine-specific) [Mycetocola sp. BIGb0189]|uniref:phage N-6-adenine-methyltransferase n=1 Tax=Mycetocola sp. BIGb0189 TaxID=2940604 RepID=UPI002168D6E0|nr:phage N-6-adenine-methyltransferase [Mycetocola sp. BIGb0189]MCS4277924.1 site-specific DNA-methyltransferase (adenine-specific) [Mycetocola sp. BIGb0189]
MGTVNSGLFTSSTDEWPTPADLFETLDREFQFTLDPCANADNAKCERYFTVDDDGLSQRWDGAVFMNPPYGRQMRHWIEKAYRSARDGATVVALIPARTDTTYWHQFVMRAAEVRFIEKRLHFSSQRHDDRVAEGKASAHNAPFPSVVVVFRPGEHFPVMSAIDRQGRRADALRGGQG